MKKLLTLTLAGVCLMAFTAAANAASAPRMEAPTQNVQVTGGSTTTADVYATHINATSVQNKSMYANSRTYLDYIYSANLSSSMFYVLQDVLASPFQEMVPTVSAETYTTGLFAYANYYNPYYPNKVLTADTKDEYGNAIDWTNAASVAAGGNDVLNTDHDQRKDVIVGRTFGINTAAADYVDSSDYDGVTTTTTAGSTTYAPNADWVDNNTYTVVNNATLDTITIALNDAQQTEWTVNSSTTIVDGVGSTSNTIYITAPETYTINIYQTWVHKNISPLVLDMQGKGTLQASNGQHMPGHPFVKDNVVMTDFYGDGFELAMEWVGPQDGLLVAPKADGSVDMSCLFGTRGGFETGYEKLGLYDTNKDNKVSGVELDGLSIWQDANGNGKADAGEVQAVSNLGISSISLAADRNFVSSFERNGKTFKMWDWWPNAIELIKVASVKTK